MAGHPHGSAARLRGRRSHRVHPLRGTYLGESAALLFTAGFAHAVNGLFSGLVSPGATLTVALYVYAKEEGEFGAAFAIAAILMFLTLIINFLPRWWANTLPKGEAYE